MPVGPAEIAVIVVLALLLFGAGRLADVGKGLGQGIKNFKQGLREADLDDEKAEAAKSDKSSKKAEKKEEAAEEA